MSNANRMESSLQAPSTQKLCLIRLIYEGQVTNSWLQYTIYSTRHTQQLLSICWMLKAIHERFFLSPSGPTSLHVLYILVWLLKQSQSDFSYIFSSSFLRWSNHFQLLSLCVVTVKMTARKKKNRSGTLNIKYIHQSPITIVHATQNNKTTGERWTLVLFSFLSFTLVSVSWTVECMRNVKQFDNVRFLYIYLNDH